MSWYKSKQEGIDQESIQSNTTPDPGHYMGKWQKHTKTHENITYKRAKRPGDYKAARNRQDSMADKHDARLQK